MDRGGARRGQSAAPPRPRRPHTPLPCCVPRSRGWCRPACTTTSQPRNADVSAGTCERVGRPRVRIAVEPAEISRHRAHGEAASAESGDRTRPDEAPRAEDCERDPLHDAMLSGKLGPRQRPSEEKLIAMDLERTYDCVVVGSGASGGTLAYGSRSGARRSCSSSGGPSSSPRPRTVTRRTAIGFPQSDYGPSRSLPCVGGPTKFYGAALYRLREVDFQATRLETGESAAWPITYSELEPYYSAAEQVYAVHGASDGDPTEPSRSAPYPYPPIPHQGMVKGLVERLQDNGVAVSACSPGSRLPGGRQVRPLRHVRCVLLPPRRQDGRRDRVHPAGRRDRERDAGDRHGVPSRALLPRRQARHGRLAPARRGRVDRPRGLRGGVRGSARLPRPARGNHGPRRIPTELETTTGASAGTCAATRSR